MTEVVRPVCFMQALLIIDSFGVPGQGVGYVTGHAKQAPVCMLLFV